MTAPAASIAPGDLVVVVRTPYPRTVKRGLRAKIASVWRMPDGKHLYFLEGLPKRALLKKEILKVVP